MPFILSMAMEKLRVLAQPGGPITNRGIFISKIKVNIKPVDNREVIPVHNTTQNRFSLRDSVCAIPTT